MDDSAATILVVEDDPSFAHLLTKILSENGYQSETAYNESMAYQYLKQNIKLVLIDIGLEKKTSGLQLAKYIQNNVQLPFIFISANEDPEIIKKAIEIKPTTYLSKPFNPLDLMANVRLAHDRTRPGDENVTLRCGRDVLRFRRCDLLYVITDGNYIWLTTTKDRYFARCTMSKLINTLNDSSFYRIHRTVLVNIQKIDRFNGKQVLIDGRWLNVARSRREGLGKAIQLISNKVPF
jgi:DNA-binding response OmpR family regulator